MRSWLILRLWNSQRFRSKALSPVEAVEFFLERMAERNPSRNAVVHVAAEEALQRAKEAEQDFLAGREVGPLHGVPTAMKDLFDFHPGWPSTFGGIRALKAFGVDGYCLWAERMEKAGAIILGKTNSPIMGFRGTTDTYLFGPTRNPFDLRKNPGGSSGGSAAAVADGLVPVAEGTDGGGSIRIPAAWSGLFGFKASFGRVPAVSRPNAFGPATPFIHEGVLARTVADAALVMKVLSGYDPRDPLSLTDTVDWAGALRQDLKGIKVAYSPNLDVFPVDPEVAAVVREAVQAFAEVEAEPECRVPGGPGFCRGGQRQPSLHPLLPLLETVQHCRGRGQHAGGDGHGRRPGGAGT